MSTKLTYGRTVKELLLNQFGKDLASSDQIFVTTFSKVSSSGMNDLRKRLRVGGAKYRVVKNSLIRKAMSDKPMAALGESADGQCGITLSKGDVTNVSKILVQFAEENEHFKVARLFFDGRLFSDDDIKKLSKLPSRQELVAKVCGGLKSPLYGMVNVLSGTLRQLVTVLDQIKGNKEKQS